MRERRVLVTCALALSVLYCTEFRELAPVSTYPERDNFSHIELVCVYDSDLPQSGVIGASFQSNGTDIEEELDSVEIVTDANSTVQTQGKGLWNGLLSKNSIGLAGIKLNGVFR